MTVKIRKHGLKVEQFYRVFLNGKLCGSIVRFSSKEWELSLHSSASKARRAVVRTFTSPTELRAFVQATVGK